jgi:NAD(P)-dependent dehydrogenase (short-subunit alcohol dehydrogenase family)
MKGPEDDAGLTGKVAILSGGGAAGDGIGNGRAAAILLARAGTKVLVADRDLKLAERTVARMKVEQPPLKRSMPLMKRSASVSSTPQSIVSAGSTFSTTISASAVAAVLLPRSPRIIAA